MKNKLKVSPLLKKYLELQKRGVYLLIDEGKRCTVKKVELQCRIRFTVSCGNQVETGETPRQYVRVDQHQRVVANTKRNSRMIPRTLAKIEEHM